MSGLWEAFKKHQPQIETYALRRGERAQHLLAGRGFDLGELEMVPLINHVFDSVLSGKPGWDPGRETVFEFFQRNIHNRIRSFEQLRRGRHLSLVSSDTPESGQFDVDKLPADPMDVRNIFDTPDWRDLLDFLALQDPRLEKLAELVQAGLGAAEQAQLLGVSDATRYRLQKKLVARILQYRAQAEQPPRAADDQDSPGRDAALGHGASE